MRQIYSVREALETLAAEQIALPAGPETLSRLKTIQGGHAAAVGEGDARAAFRANMAFHEALFAACGNPHLVDLIQMMAQKAP
ncbi:FCD domain-containing protein [Bosea sp. BIWAKO-01]|uniref:FCD domain-containing protein n=1 Tax=Bosea sp. BIWAKO-01 TaxID=506668 RepID=UPI000853399D|nr:FCD domain-containing protein [Bosea sp. BIWAKO-01]GAU86168.1 transcriptional regulator of GntR family [Bosea sp. BIWAKO-01]